LTDNNVLKVLYFPACNILKTYLIITIYFATIYVPKVPLNPKQPTTFSRIYVSNNLLTDLTWLDLS